MADTLKTFCGACVCISVSTLLLLLLFSFRFVEFTQYGLDYSTITKTVERLGDN